MDNELTVFKCHRQRVQLAMQEWLLRWSLPEWPGIVCPDCKGSSFAKLMSSKGLKTHICKSCRHTFSLNDVPGCHCTFPGKLPKCVTCKHYLDLMRYVNQRLPELQQISDAEVNARFNPKAYVGRDMNRRSGEVESAVQQEPSFPEGTDHQWVQLSFIDSERSTHE